MLPAVQGQLGLVNAIKVLTEKGYTVSVPLIDNQDYDLVVEVDKVLKKVQVKSSATKAASGNYIFQIKKVRANRTCSIIHKFDNTSVDYLFLYVVGGNGYFIPASEVTTTSTITLTKDLEKYCIGVVSTASTSDSKSES